MSVIDNYYYDPNSDRYYRKGTKPSNINTDYIYNEHRFPTMQDIQKAYYKASGVQNEIEATLRFIDVVLDNLSKALAEDDVHNVVKCKVMLKEARRDLMEREYYPHAMETASNLC